jgi:hypothetical protein
MKKIPEAFSPATWEVADVMAVQACVAGTATPEQQQRAIDWIVYRAANTDEVEYRPEERDHVFASGRRFVGLQIRKLMALKPQVFMKQQIGG